MHTPRPRRRPLVLALGLTLALTAATPAVAAARASAIFLHPDGMGPNTWGAARLLAAGPDGRLAWDRLDRVGLYVGPMTDSVTASSNGGGTSHAWGVRVDSNAFGTLDGAPIAAAASGAAMPLLREAQKAGKAVGLVNSASLTDAGTGTQVAVVASRRDHEAIAAQMIEAGVDVLLGGGEQYFLPVGVAGAHGPGARADGRNLVAEAEAAGYRVVTDRAGLAAAVAAGAPKVLGLFAHENTFAEGSEEMMAAAGVSVFQPQAPRYDEMVAAAIALLRPAANGFYLMAEEEATDNLGGDNHAAGVLEAVLGADRAIGHALDALAADPGLTVLVASDSDCGGLQVTGDDVVAGAPLPPTLENGSPLDGDAGTGSFPFLAAPDARGVRHPFAVAWASDGDMSGGGVVRAAGRRADALPATADSTDVYRVLHAALFD